MMVEDKRTKILLKSTGARENDEKLKVSQRFASEDIVAPKSFDYKNYFQMKQFKIQQAFAKPDSTSFIDLSTIYETSEVQNMLGLSSEVMNHQNIL